MAGSAHDHRPDRLHLWGSTHRDPLSNIFVKLQVAGRAQAIVKARDAGLGGLGEGPRGDAGR